MSTLVIASSAKDYNNLVHKGFLKDIKDAFNATKLTWCNSADCLTSLSQEVDYILYFNSFKDMTYDKVRSLAAASSTVDNVYGVELKDNKIWLYEDGIIADCIAHNDNIGVAIKAAMNRSQSIIQHGDLVLMLGVILLFLTFLTAFIDKVGFDKKAYAQPQQETQQVEEKEDARLPLFFVE